MAIRMWSLRTIATVCLVALLASEMFGQAPQPGTKAVAVVNGEPITLAEVDGILEARPLLSLKLSVAERRDLQKEALDMLIDELLVQQYLRKNAPPVPPGQVNQNLKELQDALKAQGQTMAEFCRDSRLTEPQVRTNLIATLQRNAYLDSRLSEAMVRKYYEDNRDFFDQVTLRVSHVMLRVKPDAPVAEREAAQMRLQSLREDIAAGKLGFAEAARQFSQCQSASRGGDLGYLPRRGPVDESFLQTAFSLQPGEISGVVQTTFGLHLIQVTDRKAGPPSEYKQREATVRAFAGEEILRAIVEQQRKVAQITVNLDDAPRPSTNHTDPAGTPGRR
jgi:peptidyl-prolyl cis-trans isomerase C